MNERVDVIPVARNKLHLYGVFPSDSRFFSFRDNNCTMVKNIICFSQGNTTEIWVNFI